MTSCRNWHVAMVGMSLFLATGCATVISGDETDTQISTDPVGAECELTGDDYHEVVVAPANVELDSDAAPVLVVCRKEGYRESQQEIDTSMDGSIFGNLILGGVIGVVVDAAAGSGMKYPDAVDLVMKPLSFATAEERDAWYASQRARIDAKYDALLAEVPQRCGGVAAYRQDAGAGGSESDCGESATAKIEELRQDEFDALERDRQVDAAATL